MKKNIAYMLLPVIGVALAAFGFIAYYIQAARAYQISQGLETKVSADSFWLQVTPHYFIMPGAVIIIVGFVLVARAVFPGMSAPADS